MLSSFSCPVCSNLCSSQAASCPKCGHPFPKQTGTAPSFLSDIEPDQPSTPAYIMIFKVLAWICMMIAILFGLIFVIALFNNPEFGTVAFGLFVKFFIGLIGYAFFSFIVSKANKG